MKEGSRAKTLRSTLKHRRGRGGGPSTTRKTHHMSAMTIPELKKSFDALEHRVSSILKSGASESQKVQKFQEAWRGIFGRPVDAAAAAAYLKVKSREGSAAAAAGRGKTLKAKKQKGGAAAGATPLAGAPVDFQTRPGIDGTHGSFLPYISSGFSFYNTVNQEAMFKDCGTQDITPKVPADLGSNQVGAGLLSDAIGAALSRPFESSAVPSVGQDMQDGWKGRELGPSPSAADTQPQYR